MNIPETFFCALAVRRTLECNIPEKRVQQALEVGETIEDYSSEMPEPSRLLLGLHGICPFHMVTSENPETNETTVIPVYIPESDKGKKDLRSRRWK